MNSADLSRFIDLRPRFFDSARALRTEFERRFSEPRRTFSDRFVWDYWHIPGQYTVIRTPARSFFPAQVFKKFEDHLLQFGGQTLGCNGISEPWLSYYIEGCSQSLHADNPHGPWAYVYSLTPWKTRRFTGGETLVARPELTEYWNHFSDREGAEFGDFFIEIPALMNQLTVFDPRLPHGVKEVRGVKDPLEGRVVIHGWFTEPRPFVEGALKKSGKFGDVLDQMLQPLNEALAGAGAFHGSLTFRLEITPSGLIRTLRFLKNTLLDLHGRGADPRVPERLVRSWAKDIQLPRARGSSTVTIPILYRS